MNSMTNNTIEIIRLIMLENGDLYFPVFDDPFFILNTEDREKRMIARALAILLSFERNSSGKVLIIGNKGVTGIKEGLSEIHEYLKDKGFDPDFLSSNIEVADVSDTTVFMEKTKDKNYSLVILEDAETYDDDDPGTSDRIRAIGCLRTDRALITANEEYDPMYEDPEDKEPEQAERGKYTACSGDVFYNPGCTAYKAVLNSVMDALDLNMGDKFRKTLMDDDMYIHQTGNHMFSLDQGYDISEAFEKPEGLYYGAFESYANESDISDRKELYGNFLRCVQKFPLIRESRYLLNNYSIYDLPSLTDKDRLMELIVALSFSDDDKARVIANFDRYYE